VESSTFITTVAFRSHLREDTGNKQMTFPPSLASVALAAAVLLLWLFLAGDASPAQLLSGVAVAAAVAAWAQLLG
jgi:hypothetical protein